MDVIGELLDIANKIESGSSIEKESAIVEPLKKIIRRFRKPKEEEIERKALLERFPLLIKKLLELIPKGWKTLRKEIEGINKSLKVSEVSMELLEKLWEDFEKKVTPVIQGVSEVMEKVGEMRAEENPIVIWFWLGKLGMAVKGWYWMETGLHRWEREFVKKIPEAFWEKTFDKLFAPKLKKILAAAEEIEKLKKWPKSYWASEKREVVSKLFKIAALIEAKKKVIRKGEIRNTVLRQIRNMKEGISLLGQGGDIKAGEVEEFKVKDPEKAKKLRRQVSIIKRGIKAMERAIEVLEEYKETKVT